jgi:tRNA(Arg) A34 adenosine deaminase TadA
MLSNNHLKAVTNRLRAKASKASTTYRVTAVAYSSKGDILGYASNNVRKNLKPLRRGAGVHAERELITRYGNKIKYIVIARFGGSGDLLPIDPCENCAKIADNLGIKIIKLTDEININ